MQGIHGRERENRKSKQKKRKTHLTHTGLLMEGLIDLGEIRFFECGNGSHIPHDFAFFFISHFIPGKQHNRRFPEASISHAFSIRRLRVSGCLAELIEKIQSRRAIGVMSSHPTCASGAAARALRRSIGTLISGSSPARVISTITVSSTPIASSMALLTVSR
jgi:hypothetical protein